MREDWVEEGEVGGGVWAEGSSEDGSGGAEYVSAADCEQMHILRDESIEDMCSIIMQDER
jgi:hypothetical protein